MRPDDLTRSLEAELAAGPDDLATHAAYADLLGEQGDPRGEFIQVQLALEDTELPPARRRELRERERALLDQHQEQWLGRLAPFLLDEEADRRQKIQFHFRRGWLDQLRLAHLPLSLARVLRDAPQARLLRDLTIEDAREEDTTPPQPDDGIPEGENEWMHGFWPLVGSPNLANLSRLQIGLDDGDNHVQYHCNVITSVVPALVRGCPRLEELHIFADGYRIEDVLAAPTLSRLRILQIHHLSAVYRLDVLARNPVCHELTHLLLHPHCLAWHRNQEDDEAAGFREEEGYLPLTVVQPLLRSRHLTKLRHLRLRVSSMGDAGCEEIVQSGMLRRLEVLDLRHGRITDDGARLLAATPDVRRLSLLDLDRNNLSREGVALLEGLGISVRATSQLGPGDDYLSEGEFE